MTRARSIAIVTTTRADYGLLRSLIRETHEDPDLELRLIVTGAHLSEDQGSTVQEIEADGYPIWRRISIFDGQADESAAARSAGRALTELGPILTDDSPDLVVVLGDRYEVLAFGLAALVFRIPLAHIHGGEITQGAIDEAVRHALTKLATYHFPSTEAYARNIVQMGEDPARVFTVGAPGLDRMSEEPELDRVEVFRRLDLDPERPAALVTYHPVTTEGKQAALDQAEAVCRGLEQSGIQVVITGANADAHGDLINERLQRAAEAHPDRMRFRMSLGSHLYINCLRHLEVMVGNSSSGIIEAPSCAMPVVNIGDRQQGRVMGANILAVDCEPGAITGAIERALDEVFRTTLKGEANPYAPYGVGSIGKSIKDRLKSVSIAPEVIKKRFHILGDDHA